MWKNKSQKLTIHKMEFNAPIGFYSFEKEQGNKFYISVNLEGDFTKSMNSDKLEDTLDYQLIYNLVAKIMLDPRDLIESLAEKIANEILTIPFSLSQVEVKVEKLNPPLEGQVSATIFELTKIKSIS